jgi:hypothetical protein
VTFRDFVPPGPVALKVSLKEVFLFVDRFCGRYTVRLIVPPEQLTEPVPARTAGVAATLHEVAFSTEAEIVDWP